MTFVAGQAVKRLLIAVAVVCAGAAESRSEGLFGHTRAFSDPWAPIWFEYPADWYGVSVEEVGQQAVVQVKDMSGSQAVCQVIMEKDEEIANIDIGTHNHIIHGHQSLRGAVDEIYDVETEYTYWGEYLDGRYAAGVIVVSGQHRNRRSEPLLILMASTAIERHRVAILCVHPGLIAPSEEHPEAVEAFMIIRRSFRVRE